MVEEYDVVVVGAGPVGLMFSACLARLGSYKIKHIDNRTEPTSIGRADGIQARTLDVLSSMGLKRPIWAYNPGLIYEVAFWGATADRNGIQRTGTSKSYPDHIDTRYPFTTILHQGRIESIFLDDLRARDVEVQRPWTIRAANYRGPGFEHPLDVELVSTDGSATETVRAKYLFGADGARSTVRALLNIPMVYKDPTVHVWSVIDGVVRSDFPDMQLKCNIRSPRGSCMIIPQGNNRVRIYVQISPEEGQDLSVEASQTKIQLMANEILSPYRVEWESVDWHSAYRIGQGISQRYSLNNRVFIGGDACHTHSPKAGQGMNYGILDSHNLAWKLHLVESGLMRLELLQTYEEERRAVASRLIEFDAAYASLFSSHNPSQQTNDEFIRIFKKNSLLTSGYGVEYPPKILIRAGNAVNSSRSSPSALRPGRSFPLLNVTRVIDACEIPLEREVPFNGSFHVYVFAGERNQHQQRALEALASHLSRHDSILSQVSDIASDPNMSYDRRHNPHSALFTFSIVFNASRESVEIASLPRFFQNYRYHIYSDDARSRKSHVGQLGAAHAKLGLNPQEGGLLLCVLMVMSGLMDGRVAAEELEKYFSGIVPSGQSNETVFSML
ncbi:hypothetical protein N7539_000141 [Penicillium diatomitis]|uniref:Phenol 2-monooxygenase n=1 Tax=Penicillium diatomitis TaxID=2819901 RepID=A0A9X0C2C9_9EURO|nr:uncharacterized protein N7539_000141 [Penicillium diatomitis]KAJ5495025.1 hypothetical protein N7539_000141 [Penicillium diatomitis]